MSNDLGLDRSGNGNNWTANNLAYSDQMVDSPTNNFATLSVNEGINGELTFSEGNLQIYRASVGSPFPGGQSNMSTGTSGKWYWEVYLVSTTNNYERIGIVTEDHPASTYLTDDTYGGKGWGWEYSGNKTSTDNGDETYGSNPTFATGEIVGVAVDVDNGTLTFYQDNVSRGVAFTGLTSQAPFRARNDSYNTSKHFYNFGQDSSFGGNKTAQGNQDGNDIGDFYYTPPTGYLALCTSNLPAVAVKPSEHFNTVLYTGNAANNRTITGVGFNPDLSWVKSRSIEKYHFFADSVRGANANLHSNVTNAEANPTTGYGDGGVGAVATDGFTLVWGTVSNNSNVNTNSATYVAWNWKANGSGSSNTNGSITSTVSANVDAGFSIVSYTGSGSAATVGHGLSKAPEWIYIKRRSGADSWRLYHQDIGLNGSYPNFMQPDLTTAVNNGDSGNFTAVPSSTLFSIGDYSVVNGSGQTYIAYCWHSVDGYSKVGSYEGNNSTDGTFVYTGFRPAYVMMKDIDTAERWVIKDATRSPYNVVDDLLAANEYSAEVANSDQYIDFLSNGFKLRASWDGVNNSETYIYIAFAETPFKYSNAR